MGSTPPLLRSLRRWVSAGVGGRERISKGLRWGGVGVGGRPTSGSLQKPIDPLVGRSNIKPTHPWVTCPDVEGAKGDQNTGVARLHSTLPATGALGGGGLRRPEWVQSPFGGGDPPAGHFRSQSTHQWVATTSNRPTHGSPAARSPAARSPPARAPGATALAAPFRARVPRRYP